LRNTTVHFENQYIRLLDRDGWFYVDRSNATGAAMIVATTSNNEIILVRTISSAIRCDMH